MTLIANKLQQAVTEEVMSNAAWFEAGALLYARADTEPYTRAAELGASQPLEAQPEADKATGD